MESVATPQPLQMPSSPAITGIFLGAQIAQAFHAQCGALEEENIGCLPHEHPGDHIDHFQENRLRSPVCQNQRQGKGQSRKEGHRHGLNGVFPYIPHGLGKFGVVVAADGLFVKNALFGVDTLSLDFNM